MLPVAITRSDLGDNLDLTRNTPIKKEKGIKRTFPPSFRTLWEGLGTIGSTTLNPSSTAEMPWPFADGEVSSSNHQQSMHSHLVSESVLDVKR
jgi:hypothetical protein